MGWNDTTQQNVLLTGKVIPREITLASRPLPRKQFQTPAPGEYNVDKLDKSKLQSGGCIRGYTFGHPNPSIKSSHTPGKGKEIFFDRFVEFKEMDDGRGKMTGFFLL